MDRLHRKKRSYGGDSLDFWYLNGTITQRDVVAAYTFIGAEDKETARKNVNPDVYFYFNEVINYQTEANASVSWNKKDGFILNGGYIGLHCEKLKNENIKAVAVRFEAPEALKFYEDPQFNCQPIVQPTTKFGLGRLVVHDRVAEIGRDMFNVNGFCVSLGTTAAFGLGFGNIGDNSNGEFVVVAGYKSTSGNGSMTFTKKNNNSQYSDTLPMYGGQNYGYKYTPYQQYTFMTTGLYRLLKIKAVAFYNRGLNKQEHIDITRKALALY